MTTRDDIIRAIVAADKAGDSDSVRKLGAYLKSSAPAPEAPSPLGSDSENFAAGVGQGLTSVYRGLRQFHGAVNPQAKAYNEMTGLQGDIDEAKKLDAPLLNTKAGLGGSITGMVAPAILTAPVSGPGLVGGAATGAVMGATQPVASDESRTKNMVIGGLAGGAAPVLARGAGALWGAARGMVEPFTEAGRNAITGRTLQRFGVNAADVAGLSGAPTATGARTSLAEQIQRPEGAAAAARLQDAVRSLDPEIAARMVARETENNASRVNLLQRMAGRDGGRDFAVSERAGTAGPMYREAFEVAADGAQMTPAQVRDMRVLMRAPAIKDAAALARANAANSGGNVGTSNASGSVEGLHQMKLALDDMIAQAENKTTGATANKATGLRDAQKRLVDFIESISPEYANARGVYRQMSRPINQMDVADEVLRRGASSTTDLAGNQRLMPNAIARLMQDEPALIRRATGRDAANSLDRLLEPGQVNQLRAVAGEVDRAGAVARAGAGPGSPTAQRLASSNLLHQIGLPENMVDNALVQTLMRPIQFGASVAEPRIQQNLLEIILDPSRAAAALRAATPAQRIQLERLIANRQLAQSVRASVPASALGTRQRGE